MAVSDPAHERGFFMNGCGLDLTISSGIFSYQGNLVDDFIHSRRYLKNKR